MSVADGRREDGTKRSSRVGLKGVMCRRLRDADSDGVVVVVVAPILRCRSMLF